MLPCLACLLAGWLACLLACLACLPACLAGLLASYLPAGFIVHPSGRRTHHPTQAHVGRQWETRGGKTSGRRTHNTGTHVGRQWETRVDKILGRRTHHPTRAHMWGDNGRQGEARPRKGGHTIQQRETRGETRPPEGGHTIQQKRTRRETMRDKGKHGWGGRGKTRGDKARQDLEKAGTSSDTCAHVPDQWLQWQWHRQWQRLQWQWHHWWQMLEWHQMRW